MATITGTGVGSGLDVNTIVTSLMTLEKRPLNQLQTRASTIQTQLSSFGNLKSQLANLSDVANRLTQSTTWNPVVVDSTDSTSVSATATTSAVAGKYRLQVSQLAQSQTLASGGFAATSTVVGTGTLTLELGTTSGSTFTPKSGSSAVTVTIGSGQETLAGVRDAINAAKAGVTASIITSGGSSRLVLRGNDGAENSMRITVADNDGNATDTAGLSALAWDPAASVGAGRNLSQTQGAQDALFNVNGIDASSTTNAATGVIDGVTLTLSKVTSAPVDLNVSVQAMAVRKNVNDFVNAYNSLNSLLQNLTKADPTGASRGALQGDSTATTLLYSLRNTVHGAVVGMDAPNSLNAAGIELQRDGSLQVKEDRFAALLQTPAKLAQLFGQAQSGGDSGTRGFAVRFKQWASSLSDEGGPLDTRIKGLSQSVTANQKQQEAINDRLTRTEARLRAQYQRLDSDMTNLNAQMKRMVASLGLGSSSTG